MLCRLLRLGLASTLLGAITPTMRARPHHSPAAPPSHAARPAAEACGETVVLLHGVALHAMFMAPLARALRAGGYHVVNLTYPSRRQTILALGDRWLPEALARHAPGGGRLHFVTHSMGGLVLRRYAATHGTARIGRIVMIAPPNQGSEAADHLSGSLLVRGVIGCNLATLGTRPGCTWRHLPPALGDGIEVGIIAGDRWINPVTGRVLPAPHDGAVSIASTHLDGERDHVVLPHSHTALPFRRATARAAISFLRTGRFTAPEITPPPAS